MLFELFLDLAMLSAQLLVWAPGLALAAWCSYWSDAPALRIASVLIGSGLAGVLLFWAWFFGSQIGEAVSVTVDIVSIGALLVGARRRLSRSGTPQTLARSGASRDPTGSSETAALALVSPLRSPMPAPRGPRRTLTT